MLSSDCLEYIYFNILRKSMVYNKFITDTDMFSQFCNIQILYISYAFLIIVGSFDFHQSIIVLLTKYSINTVPNLRNPRTFWTHITSSVNSVSFELYVTTVTFIDLQLAMHPASM